MRCFVSLATKGSWIIDVGGEELRGDTTDEAPANEAELLRRSGDMPQVHLTNWSPPTSAKSNKLLLDSSTFPGAPHVLSSIFSSLVSHHAPVVDLKPSFLK